MYQSKIEPAREQETVQSRPLRRKAAWLALPAAGVALFALKGLAPDAAQADAPPPATVTVSAPLVRDVVEWDDFVGRFEASKSVEIKPRVSGALQSIHFRDGDIVGKGQLLFVIDPRPYAAALAEAKAREAAAVTALALARSELARATRLIADDAVSREEIDTLRAAVRSAEAAVGGARAQVRSRALDVEFTRVRSPIAGRVSDRRIDVGNLVSGGADAGGTLLTTVQALDPMYFSFEGSEALYLKHLREGGSSEISGGAEIRLQDEPDYRWKGRIDFTDNSVDTRSGTIRARAVVPNPQHFLKPGLFGNMRLTAGAPRAAMLVPDAAVRTDQVRKVVLVVGPDNMVSQKPVETGALLGGLRVVRSGLKRDDRVVIDGIASAMPGAKVNPMRGTIRATAQSGGTAPITAATASQATLAVR